MKNYFYTIFLDTTSERFSRVNSFYAIITTAAILALVLETVDSLQFLYPFFTLIEYIAFVFFSIEYVGRIIAAPKKSEYIFSFFGIVDFLSIFPTVIQIGNLSFLKSVRILRITRFIRVLQIMKLSRSQRERTKENITKLNFEIYFIALMSAIIIFASLIHVVEGYREEFAHIPIAMIWSAKVVLGGFKVLEPYTITGQLIMIFGRFIGLILFGLLITVVGGFVKKLLFGSEDIHQPICHPVKSKGGKENSGKNKNKGKDKTKKQKTKAVASIASKAKVKKVSDKVKKSASKKKKSPKK